MFIIGDRKDIEFDVQVECARRSLRTTISTNHHVIHFKFQGTKHTRGIIEARIVKFLTQVGYI